MSLRKWGRGGPGGRWGVEIYQEAQDRAAARQLADQGHRNGSSHEQPDGLDEALCAMGHIWQGQLAGQLPH